MTTLKSISKYKIIIVFLTYIFIISLLISFTSQKNFMIIFMGLFFILFSFFKVIHLKEFKKSFSKYDPMSQKIPFYGFIYPFIEIILGILFLLEYQLKILSLITIFILTSTTIGIFEKLRKGDVLECACLGVVFKVPLSYLTVVENLVMIFMSVLILVCFSVLHFSGVCF